MNTTHIKVLGAVLCAVALTVPAAQAAQPAGAGKEMASSAATQSEYQAIRFRASMGFVHDLRTVRAIDRAAKTKSPTDSSGKMLSAADVSTELGLPLTLSEQKEVDLRHKVIEDDVPLIRRFMKSGHPQEFAGVFMDI